MKTRTIPLFPSLRGDVLVLAHYTDTFGSLICEASHKAKAVGVQCLMSSMMMVASLIKYRRRHLADSHDVNLLRSDHLE